MAADTRTSIVADPARRREASSPTPTIPRITAIAIAGWRRAISPTRTPTSSTAATTTTVSAVLSLVPNSETMKSLDPAGAKSMTAAPTAAIGEGMPTIRPANSSPTASATIADTAPAIAASPRGARATVEACWPPATPEVLAEAGAGWLMAPVSRSRVTVA